MKRHRDPMWQAKVDHTRKESMRVIRDIRQGYVNEIDIDMLQNFVMFALALMQAQGPKNWGLAKLNAELMHFVHSPVPEVEQPQDCAEPASAQQ